MLDLMVREAPREIGFAELAAAAGSPSLPQVLAPLRMACTIELITPHASPQPFVSIPSERPKASPLARAMLADGARAVTLRHHVTDLEERMRRLAGLCDGAHTRAEMASELGFAVADVDRALGELGRLGLLLP
jgi:hypothetical protein